MDKLRKIIYLSNINLTKLFYHVTKAPSQNREVSQTRPKSPDCGILVSDLKYTGILVWIGF